MANDDETARKQKTFKAVMAGLMVGSGLFLALRFLLKLDVDPSLIAGAGVGVAVAVFLIKRGQDAA